MAAPVVSVQFSVCENHARVLSRLVKFLEDAREQALNGRIEVKLNLKQGGVSSKEFALVEVEN